MNTVYIVLATIALGLIIGRMLKHKSLYPLMPFKYDFRRRRNTFRKALKIMERIEARVIIETGTARAGLYGAQSQGAATIVFGTWAKHNGAFVHSVDISEEAVRVAREEVEAQGLSKYVEIHLSDSIEFLKNFKEKVDFLYLDSYDYSPTDTTIQRQSQEHHLAEFKAIEDQLHKNSMVLIDDCRLPGGGKGKLVIEYMKSRGWVVYMEAYQVLLLRQDSDIVSGKKKL